LTIKIQNRIQIPFWKSNPEYKKYILEKKIQKHIPEKGVRNVFLSVSPFYLRVFSSFQTEVGCRFKFDMVQKVIAIAVPTSS